MKDLASVLTLLVALRVLIPDARRVLKRLLGEGVRLGTAALAEQRRHQVTPLDTARDDAEGERA